MDSSKLIEEDKKSKKSTKNDESVLSKGQKEQVEDEVEEEEEELITKDERKKCLDTFHTISKGSGLIKVEEMLIIAKALHDDPTFPEEEIFDILQDDYVNTTRRLNEDHFMQIVEELKKRENKANEEDTIDAYVALGGLGNKGGWVDADQLIKIVKEDFEMTIDIVKLIKEIDEDGSGKIEYGEFNSLLNANQ